MLRSARDGNRAAGFGCRLEGFDVAQRSMRTRIARTSTDLSEPEEIAVIEIKAARIIAKEHEAQLLSELRASTHPVGLLLNFGAEPTFKRMVGPPR